MKITSPGITRFFSLKELPLCPECKSEDVGWHIHKKVDDENVWQADCTCGNCGCRFEAEKTFEDLFDEIKE